MSGVRKSSDEDASDASASEHGSGLADVHPAMNRTMLATCLTRAKETRKTPLKTHSASQRNECSRGSEGFNLLSHLENCGELQLQMYSLCTFSCVSVVSCLLLHGPGQSAAAL